MVVASTVWQCSGHYVEVRLTWQAGHDIAVAFDEVQVTCGLNVGKMAAIGLSGSQDYDATLLCACASSRN